MVEILQCCEPKRTAIVLFENRMMYHSYYCYVGKINPYFEFRDLILSSAYTYISEQGIVCYFNRNLTVSLVSGKSSKFLAQPECCDCTSVSNMIRGLVKILT